MRRTAAKPPADTPTPERSTRETAPLDRRHQEDDPPTVPRRFLVDAALLPPDGGLPPVSLSPPRLTATAPDADAQRTAAAPMPSPQSANGANATAPYRFLASRRHGPTDPVLGANPSSEGTDPFCRLPLPTLMPSTRGCTPWRPAADGGYGPTRELRKPDPDFPGPPKAHRTPPEPRRSTGTFSVSPDEPIPRTWSFTKKRELFPGLPATSPGSLASPRFRPGSDGRRRHRCRRRRHPRALSESGFGNINPIPFRREAGRFQFFYLSVFFCQSRIRRLSGRLSPAS